MHEVEKMIGVLHDTVITMNPKEGFIDGDAISQPSEDLQSLLRTLPSATKIGVEYHPDLATRNFHDARVSEEDLAYWQAVERLCVELGLQLIYMDDPELRLRAAELSNKASEIIQKPRNRYTDYDQFRTSERLTTKSFWIMDVKRRKHMLDAIQREKPQVVLLGRDSADILAVNPRIATKHGITVREHLTEHEVANDQVQFGGELDNRLVLENKLSRRTRSSVLKGRVRPKATPHLIGYRWSAAPLYPAQGLFEIRFNEDGKTGILYDCYGDAQVTNISVEEHQVSFTIQYEAGKSMYVDREHPIHFTGKKSGRFGTKSQGTTVGKSCGAGEFILQQFEPGMRLGYGGEFITE
jgi:hypothetical protein